MKDISGEAFAVRHDSSGTQTFEKIFYAYYASLCFFATRILKDEEAARDIVQEVFIRLWERALSFESAAAARSYLYVSVQHKSFNYLEKQNNRRRVRERLEMARDTGDPLLLQVEADLVQALSAAIDELPEQCRMVFTLSYLEQRDIREVAQLLNIAETTVKTHRRRAKEFLRTRLRGKESWLLLFFLFSPNH